MKAKLSFLVLPLCLGFVLTFVLVACGGDSGTNSPSGTTSSGSEYRPSSGSVDVPGSIEFSDDFGVEPYGDKVYIVGEIDASKSKPITKLEFTTTQSSWILYSGTQPPTPSISLYPKTVIDLTNSSIPCGTHNFTVKACIDGGICASRNGTFEKPDSYCKVSSSSVEVSSSSVASWKFEWPVIDTVSANRPVTIGSGSFVLLGDEDIVDQPDLKINGGKVRVPLALCGDDTPTPGVSYSGTEDCLGSKKAEFSSLVQINKDLGVQAFEYYLVYLDDGGIYLLQFTKRDGALFTSWPIKYTFWTATEHP